MTDRYLAVAIAAFYFALLGYCMDQYAEQIKIEIRTTCGVSNG